VPEQFSYATEKKLIKALGGKASINAEVINFNLIAYRMLTEVRRKNKNPAFKKWTSNASI